MHLLGRIAQIISAILFGVWAILKIASDLSGVAVMIDDPSQSLKAINDGLIWLFSTPWWAPALLAVVALCLIFWPTLTEIFQYTTDHRQLSAQQHEADHRGQIRMSIALLLTIVFGVGFFSCAVWYGLEKRPVVTAGLREEAPPSPQVAPAKIDAAPPPKMAEAPAPTAPPLPAPTAPSHKPGRDYVSAEITPEYLVGLYDGNTRLRADTLVSDQVGKWMRVSGALGEVQPSGKTDALVVFASRTKPTIYMWFSSEWLARLALLSKNQNINVEGQLKTVQSYNATVILENCELLDDTK